MCNPRGISYSTGGGSAEAPQLADRLGTRGRAGDLGSSRPILTYPKVSIRHPNATVLVLMLIRCLLEKLTDFTHHQHAGDIQTQPRHDSFGTQVIVSDKSLSMSGILLSRLEIFP